MFTEERQNAIEKCLREKGKVRVKELSEMFQVTEDCIRKDLKILENAGRLKRTYGGAILSQEYPLERNVVERISDAGRFISVCSAYAFSKPMLIIFPA